MPSNHPAHSAHCTKSQVDAFELIAVGRSDQAYAEYSAKTIQALIDKGLVVLVGVKGVHPTYEVPIDKHIEWCKWCDEHISDPDTERCAKTPDMFKGV